MLLTWACLPSSKSNDLPEQMYWLFPVIPIEDHMLKDIVHLLDTSLWQESIDRRRSPADAVELSRMITRPLFDTQNRHVLLPQSKKDFVHTTGKDINRFVKVRIQETTETGGSNASCAKE